MRAALRRRLAALGSALLTAAAVLGTACLIATIVAPLAGIRPLIFLSGSMSPTIPAGSLALARTVEAEAIEVDDIVTVRSNDAYLTHRVVEVTHAPGKATLLLRGDGNEAVDATLYEVTSAPRTEIWVPYVGTGIAWFSRPPGVYVLAGWVALVLGTLRRRRHRRQPSPRRGAAGSPKLLLALQRRLPGGRLLTPRVRLVWGIALTVTFAFGSVLVATPALASWADTVTVTGTSLSTVTPTAPVASCVTPTVTNITVSWTAMPGATGYRLSYGDQNSPTIEEVGPGVLTKTFPNRVDGRFTVRTLYGSTWISAPSNQLRYDSAGGGSCVG